MNNIEKTIKIKEDFKKILIDFCKDLSNTFPELKQDLSSMIENDANMDNVYNYCKTIFPERFFDILYQNNEIFTNFENTEKTNTYFLPNINFADLWKMDITDKTKDTIWKYLQLILFTIINDVSDCNSFGNTAKLFETINENEFKVKLEETIENMKNLFDESNNMFDMSNNMFDMSLNNMFDSSGINLDDLPNAEKMHEHISGMLDGKLGKLAREIAEETANNLDVDMNNVSNVNDVFQTMFKNPGKLMNLVKNIGDKLDNKIKSGELKESELLEEASNIVNRMKNMPLSLIHI